MGVLCLVRTLGILALPAQGPLMGPRHSKHPINLLHGSHAILAGASTSWTVQRVSSSSTDRHNRIAVLTFPL